MIVGFSRHSTGSGRGPTQYMTDRKRSGREKNPPVVLRGNAEKTSQLIDSLSFKHKYTSGVLSFAPGENISPDMEQAIIDRFESLAFAGLESDQYNILWVRHTHAKHHELHFVTPRVELISGNSMNIRPPGGRTKRHYDDFRSEINAKYGLADPTDPDRARNVSTPDHELKIASEAIRNGEKAPKNMRELIDNVLSQRAIQGLIRNRKELLKHAKDLGFDITRAGKDYITVREPHNGRRWRLKGTLYARDYEPGRAIEAANTARKRDYSKPNPKAAQNYAKRVERHIERRARYNRSRYSKPEQTHRMAHVQESVTMANANQPESLHRYLQRKLDDTTLLHSSDYGATTQRPNLGTKGRQDQIQPMRRTASTMRSSATRDGEIREKRRELHDSEGVLNDRTRNTLIERFKAFGTAIQRTTARITTSTKRLTNNVRAYFTRKQKLTSASQQLEQSSHQLKQANPTIQRAIQQEQSLGQKQQR